jgi:hypothetical protein
VRAYPHQTPTSPPQQKSHPKSGWHAAVRLAEPPVAAAPSFASPCKSDGLRPTRHPATMVWCLHCTPGGSGPVTASTGRDLVEKLKALIGRPETPRVC